MGGSNSTISSNSISPSISPSKRKQREEKFLTELPMGSEKNLINLINASQVNKAQLEECQQKLFDEGFVDNEITQRLDQAKAGGHHQNILHEILQNHVQILRIRIFDKVLKEHERGIDVVKNKDIVFFFGKTGSGKSTTILYLLGCKMKKKNQKVDAIKKPPELTRVRPSHKFKSGTPFLEVVGDFPCIKNPLFLCFVILQGSLTHKALKSK